MVSHPPVRVYGTALRRRNFAQFLQVAHAINAVEDARLAMATALPDMLRDMGEVEAGLASHGCARVVTYQARCLALVASVRGCSPCM